MTTNHLQVVSFLRQAFDNEGRCLHERGQGHLNKGSVFDSAASKEFLAEGIHKSQLKTPKKLQLVLKEARRHQIVRGLFDSSAQYGQDHGSENPADLVEQLFT
ncbi:hypothetical protein HZU77_003975 [Neisseriaceae bacterium TC5R-5]|nr:hypothetical protein [Neisseriaceae bacterium TC5R-5]